MKTNKFLVYMFIFISIGIQGKPKVTFSMIMKNEAGRKLRECLQEVAHYIDEAVIIDDCSTDNSIEIAEEVLKNIPHRIIRNDTSKFANEISLRKQQWEETIKTNPEWILNIDADQIFETKMREEIDKLINQNEIDVWAFRLYDFWSETHYRDDAMWQAHNSYRPFLIRYRPEFHYTWKETPQHCGHLPLNVYQLPNALCSIRLKHYGWATEADRIAKYYRYMQLDPGAQYGWQKQYDSILDTNPHVVEWIE
jgi:glycosyltransferase involved in cell wall biosynthesis